MTKFEDNFKNAEKTVEYCLRKFPETRENDRTLMIKVWDLQGFRFPKKLVNFFYKVHSPETIRRCRQKLQSGGLYKPDPLKTAERSLFSMRHREYHRRTRTAPGNGSVVDRPSDRQPIQANS